MNLISTIIIAIISFVVYLVNSLIGFGSSSLAAGFLLKLAPYQVVIPALVLTRSLSYFILFPKNYKKADYSVIKLPLIGGIIGVFLGTFIFVKVSNVLLEYVFAFTIFIFGLIILFRGIKKVLPKNRILDLTFGFVSGLMGVVFSTAGPSLAIYLSHKEDDIKELRAEMIVVFAILGVFKLISYSLAGIWNLEILQMVLIILPFMFLGTFVGSKFSKKIDKNIFYKIEGLILILSAVVIYL
jgi:uncharacterized membrane protein YfcA